MGLRGLDSRPCMGLCLVGFGVWSFLYVFVVLLRFSCVVVWGGAVLGSWASYWGLMFRVSCCCGDELKGILGF